MNFFILNASLNGIDASELEMRVREVDDALKYLWQDEDLHGYLIALMQGFHRGCASLHDWQIGESGILESIDLAIDLAYVVKDDYLAPILEAFYRLLHYMETLDMDHTDQTAIRSYCSCFLLLLEETAELA